MLIAWLKAKAAAKRMGIRDRGSTGVEHTENGYLISVHTLCRTRTRVGIAPNGATVTYCWRCEKIIRNEKGSGPNKKPGDLLKFRLIKSDDGGGKSA